MASTSVVYCIPAVVCGKAGKYLRSQTQRSSESAGGGGAEDGGGGGEMGAIPQPSRDTHSPWKAGGLLESPGSVPESRRRGV